MGHLAVAAFHASESRTPRSPEALIAMKWADALLRSRHPSPKRVEACYRLIKREFGL